ncbi:MAG: KOW domain-containing RNA-binding protein [Synergistales bacterium]|nr:KOW domain-containing RNA-binding protein [Synergistales bacterium]
MGGIRDDDPGLQPGLAVRSTAGKDRGRLYVVLASAENERIRVTDGRRRPVGHPKPKNPRHLQPIQRVLPQAEAVLQKERDETVNRTVRDFLNDLEEEQTKTRVGERENNGQR